MKLFAACIVILSIVVLVATGCGKKASRQEKADAFLEKYLKEYAAVYTEWSESYWQAANSGKQEDFDAYAKADLKMKKIHSDSKRYTQLTELLSDETELKPLTLRSLKVADLEFKGNQLPEDILEKLSNTAAGIEQIFTAFRGKMDGKEYTDNELKTMLKNEVDSAKRQTIWEALKQVGDAVAPKLIELAKIRNEAAKKLGFKDFWHMQIRLQEHDPQEILTIFGELEKVTHQPFKEMKARMDAELAARFNIKAEEMKPWHYDNPFFQEPPPSDKIDIDIFYKENTKEDIVEFSKKFFADVGLPIEDIVKRSDLYERKGKQQHAFTTAIDLKGDVRVLVNIKPTAYWMDTVLHEMGHAVYDKFIDFSLPENLRHPAHSFTTEAIAMLFGALAKNPLWMVNYAGADEQKVKEAEEAILEQRTREQLIFARWTLVMLYFEKAFYENPDRDLNTLWWDFVEQYQMLTRPAGRDAADWAAKIHFTIAPVYYHNYMLGELLAAQLRGTLVKLAGHSGTAATLDYGKHKEFGDFFKNKIFKPAAVQPWPEFVKSACGEPLTAKYFAEELK